MLMMEISIFRHSESDQEMCATLCYTPKHIRPRPFLRCRQDPWSLMYKTPFRGGLASDAGVDQSLLVERIDPFFEICNDAFGTASHFLHAIYAREGTSVFFCSSDRLGPLDKGTSTYSCELPLSLSDSKTKDADLDRFDMIMIIFIYNKKERDTSWSKSNNNAHGLPCF